MAGGVKNDSGGRYKRTAASRRRQSIACLQKRLWQAEFIGWKALAESFRRDLRAMGVEA